jgi:hypothetical protein
MPRKEKKAKPPTMSLVFVGMACFFIVGSGAGYLWNKSQINTLGAQMRQYELRLESAKRHRLILEQIYATNCSPAYLEMRVKRMRLDIGPPEPDQLVRLPENSGIGQEEKLVARRASAADEEGRN